MQALVEARALGSYRGQPINELENALDNAVQASVRQPDRKSVV